MSYEFYAVNPETGELFIAKGEKISRDKAIEIEDSVYEKLEEISKENDISINDYLIYLIQEDLISKVDKPTGIHKVIDEAYLSLYIEELIDSKTNCLIVDINNFEPKCVLLINEDYEKLKKVED